MRLRRKNTTQYIVLGVVGIVVLTLIYFSVHRASFRYFPPKSSTQDRKVVLVTGGAGFIGSHTCISLIEAGYGVVIVDNLANAEAKVVDTIQDLTGYGVHFYHGDVADPLLLESIFLRHSIFAVVHFAGLKSVAESVADPLRYYQVNLGTTMTLLEAMTRYGVRQMVFSSSATVYAPAKVAVQETDAVAPSTPYGETKLMLERMIADWSKATSGRAVSLRYFNPIGAHPSGRLGEKPRGPANNIMPMIGRVLLGEAEIFSIYGSDYATRDGTGERDYIHVVDLAEGHIAALTYLEDFPGSHVFNLGTGKPTSVLELVGAMEKASGKKLAVEKKPRRSGDLGIVYADASRARDKLGWHAKRDLDEMCTSAWKYLKQRS